MIRYAVYPGYVTSVTDGQRHYIGAMRLMQLYRVSHSECVVYEPAQWWTDGIYRMEAERVSGLIALYPKANGEYSTENQPRVQCHTGGDA